MTETVRVFINGSPVDLSRGATVSDALATIGGGLAEKLVGGAASVTDGRGIELDPSAPLASGAILRVIVRARRGTADADT